MKKSSKKRQKVEIEAESGDIAPKFRVFPSITGSGASSSTIMAFLSKKRFPQDILVIGILDDNDDCSLLEILSDRLDINGEAPSLTDTPSIESYFSLYSPFPNQYSVLFLHFSSILGDRALSSALKTVLQKAGTDYSAKMFQTNPHVWLERREMENLKALLFLFMCSHVILVGKGMGTRQLARDLDRVKTMKGMYINNHRGQGKSGDSSRTPAVVSSGPLLYFLEKDGDVEEAEAIDREKKLKLMFEGAARGEKVANGQDIGSQEHSLFAFDPSSCIVQLPREKSDWMRSVYQKVASGSILRRMILRKGNFPSTKSWFYCVRELMDFMKQPAGQNFGAKHQASRHNSRGHTLSSSSCNGIGGSHQESWLDQQVLKLLSQGHIDFDFSSEMCTRAFNEAKSVYQTDLPQRYTAEIHKQHLAIAAERLKDSARGPALFVHLKILEDECTAYWRNGRQSCEEFSLTGRRCIVSHQYPRSTYRQHGGAASGSGGARPSPKNDIRNSRHQQLDHDSGFYCIHACNCGRSRATRRDPFSVEDANSSFYEDNFYGKSDETNERRRNCCSFLKHIDVKVAVFLSSTQKDLDERRIGDSAVENAKLSDSFKLLRLGNANYYNHDVGLLQEGFVAGRNIMVKIKLPEASERAPSGEIFVDEGAIIRNSDVDQAFKEKVLSEMGVNLKRYEGSAVAVPAGDGKTELGEDAGAFVYFGLEYESSSGLRFILSEGEIQRANAPLGQKQSKTAESVLGSCVPVSFTVRTAGADGSEKMSFLQLQRIYVVTPKEGSVTLQPRIKMDNMSRNKGEKTHRKRGSAPETQDTTALQFRVKPIRLDPDSTFVFRLPYVYSHGNSVANLRESAYSGRLLKNCISFS